MERLTQRCNCGICGSNGNVLLYPLYRIGGDEYMDHGLINQCFEKLAHYEDLEERGLLLRLPCKVGDSVWLLFADGCIEEHTVSSIRIGNTVDNICFENDSYYTVWDKDYKSLNKWFFTTREEAEAAMAKMEGESNVVT